MARFLERKLLAIIVLPHEFKNTGHVHSIFEPKEIKTQTELNFGSAGSFILKKPAS